MKFATYGAMDLFGEVWIRPLADNSAGMVASEKIAFTGPATAADIFPRYLVGISMPVAAILLDAVVRLQPAKELGRTCLDSVAESDRPRVDAMFAETAALAAA